MEKTNKPDLFYLDCVETMYRTLDSEILKCMSKLTNYILVSCGFSSDDTPKCINLLNFLNAQHLSCQSFIKEYGKMTEEV